MPVNQAKGELWKRSLIGPYITAWLQRGFMLNLIMPLTASYWCGLMAIKWQAKGEYAKLAGLKQIISLNRCSILSKRKESTCYAASAAAYPTEIRLTAEYFRWTIIKAYFILP